MSTLLELVQDVLSDIDGDEVNSISDTEESDQVARIVKNTYNSIVSNSNWPHTRRAVALIPRSDNAFPTHMSAIDELKELISVRYNIVEFGSTRKNYRLLTYKDPDEFLNILNKRDNTKSNVDVIIDDSGIELLILTDKAPEYYTSFDDRGVVFDSYDSAVDSSLQASKTQAQGFIIPSFSLTDSFVPDLPPDAFAKLREESVSRAQFKLRQLQDFKSEQESQRQSRWLSRKNWIVEGGIKYPNYGRKSARLPTHNFKKD